MLRSQLHQKEKIRIYEFIKKHSKYNKAEHTDAEFCVMIREKLSLNINPGCLSRLRVAGEIKPCYRKSENNGKLSKSRIQENMEGLERRVVVLELALLELQTSTSRLDKVNV